LFVVVLCFAFPVFSCIFFVLWKFVCAFVSLLLVDVSLVLRVSFAYFVLMITVGYLCSHFSLFVRSSCDLVLLLLLLLLLLVCVGLGVVTLHGLKNAARLFRAA